MIGDPVAEVRSLKPVQNFNQCGLSPQAKDLNLDNEGGEMSKTTDVNPDYDN